MADILDFYHAHVKLPAQISLTLSLTTILYRSSLLGGLQGYILYQHRAVVYRF